MHRGRLSKRMRLEWRRRQTLKADRRPGNHLYFDRTQEYEAVPNAVAFAEFDGGGDRDRIRVDLLRCCHCDKLFGVRRKGRHGYCLKCAARTCGAVACDACRPAGGR